MATHKTCNSCHQELPLEDFYKQERGKLGRTAKCKACYKEAYAAQTPSYRRTYKYGLSEDDYAALLDMQDYKCAICRDAGVLVVDHDHVTGDVRGLLCYKCNTGLGQFRDDPELLRQALQYMEGRVTP